jgi:probable F420-dependent oxidoreductase
MVQIALYAHTHGVGFRDESGNRTLSQPAASLDPVRVARAAEAAGFHSMWFPDHVCMPAETTSAHVVNASGRRSYAPRHEMLDALVTMGAVAAATRTIRLATSVLIAPYRHPLSDARQFATVDVLSGGRVIVGVGAGWMREEFEAIGVPHGERGSRTEECIEIYRRAFTDDRVTFTGRHHSFADVSMDPKPAHGTPIVYGGMSPVGARRAARLCDGLYPLFLDPSIPPEDKSHLHEIVRGELEANGRDPATFTMLAATGMRVDDASRPVDGTTCGGTADQVIDDVARFAAAGYSTLVCKMDCPSGTIDELLEQIERVGSEVIPAVAGITASGGWRQGL